MSGQQQLLALENRHTGERLAMRRVKRGDEVWLELKGSLAAGRDGPPLHAHVEEDEDGVVSAGTLAAVCDGVQMTVATGGSVKLPRGSAHRWWNGGKDTLVFEGYVHPAVDFDRFVQASFEVLNAGPAGRPPIFYMAHVSFRHRHTQRLLIIPGVVQAVLFRVVIGIGIVLGKYRGTEWPGCPARCPGAPLVAE